MIRLRDPFGQALDGLRRALAEGRHTAGRPIVIADEARALRLSTPPVREALCWLGGEGVVERGAAGGFVAPRLDAAALAQRYDFRGLCLLEMSRRTCATPPPGLITAETAARRLEDLWRWRMRSLGDVGLYEAFAAVQGRLARFTAAENRVFVDVEAEAEALLRSDPDEAAVLVRAHHDRRAAAAALLVLEAEADGPAGAEGEP